MKVQIGYKTTLPLVAGGPTVTFLPEYLEELEKQYRVLFYDLDREVLHKEVLTSPGEKISAQRQWYTNWRTVVTDAEGKFIYGEDFNCEGKVVFIKSDSSALGDTLAWLAYFEEFRKQRKCTVICSTFFNKLFQKQYPNLLFAEPNTNIENVYVQYYVGANVKENNPTYSPGRSIDRPLQKVACDILGLEYKELRPDLGVPEDVVKQKKVTLSQYASSEAKGWHAEGGWQKIVDLFNSYGFEVCVISKEPTTLQNVTDRTGAISLEDRVKDIATAQYHVGVSSGLSWLAWAAKTHTFLISDHTPPYHEFQLDVTRLYNPDAVKTVVSVEGPQAPAPVAYVLDKIQEKLIRDGFSKA